MGSFVLLAMIPQLDWPSLTKVRGVVGVGGGRSSENNAIRSLPASKNRRPRFLPERDVKANFTNFRLNFPKMSWSTLCCPEICNKINQYVYASLHTHHKYGCFIWVNVCKPGILAVLHQAKPWKPEIHCYAISKKFLCPSLWTQFPTFVSLLQFLFLTCSIVGAFSVPHFDCNNPKYVWTPYGMPKMPFV